MKKTKRTLIAVCIAFNGVAFGQVITTNCPDVADVDIRSYPAPSPDLGYNRTVLIVFNKNADPALAEDGKAYIRFRLPPDFGTVTSATFTMTRDIIGTANWTYNVYGLDQGPIPGSPWTTLTWPELDGGNGTNAAVLGTNATTWNDAPGNVIDDATNFTSSEFLGTYTVSNAANGGHAGDSYSMSGTNLVNFLNEATNYFVTLMVSRNGVSSSGDQWASKELGTYPGPALSITYTPSTNVEVNFSEEPTPTNQTVYATLNAVFNSVVGGTQPITYQWSFNGTNLADGPNIIGANSNILTLHNLTTDMSGNYSLVASNEFGEAVSSNATLTVSPANVLFNTGQMTNIWNLLPGDRPYLTTFNAERGLAYDPFTTNLLIVSSLSNTVSEWVPVLDAQTGTDKWTLNTVGVFPGVGSSSLGLNLIGVGSDGTVYGAGQTINATNYAYYIYQWPDDSPNNYPTMVFAGDPGRGVIPGLHWGDNFAVRGAGSDAQILIAPSTGTNVILLQTSSGTDFQYEIPPAVIAVSGLPTNLPTNTNADSGFAERGIWFGPGTNTFWAKDFNNQLYLIQFDLNSKTGSVLHAYPNSEVSSNIVGIAADQDQKFLAGVSLDPMGENVQLYNISDLTAGPMLLDQAFYSTPNNPASWASTAFGGNYLFALDVNNGIKAFLINTNWSSLSPFSISSIAQNGGAIIFTWPSSAGHNYQVQSVNSLSAGSWSNLNNVIMGTGGTMSFTNNISSITNMFYRVQAN